MKWYWVLLIAIIAIIIGYSLSKFKERNEPIKKNTERIVNDLQNELNSIDLWLGGRPNTSDPNYETTKQTFIKRKEEILSILKSIFGCTGDIIIADGKTGGYTYNCA